MNDETEQERLERADYRRAMARCRENNVGTIYHDLDDRVELLIRERDVNVRRAAVMPDLLDALESLFAYLDASGETVNTLERDWNRRCRIARDAIAKARAE